MHQQAGKTVRERACASYLVRGVPENIPAKQMEDILAAPHNFTGLFEGFKVRGEFRLRSGLGIK